MRLMLETILQNKSLTNTLGFFLSSPERAFFIGDLQKRLGRGVVKPLNELQKMDLVKVFTKKNLTYCILNQRNKNLPEIKSKVLKASKKFAEDEIVKAIRKMPKIKVAVLCGLFSANPELACDLLLVGDISKKRLDSFVKMTEKMIGQELNYALFDAKEYQFRKNIFDRFIKDIFENPHLVLVNKVK